MRVGWTKCLSAGILFTCLIVISWPSAIHLSAMHEPFNVMADA